MKKYNRFSLFLSSVLLVVLMGGGLAFSASFSAQQFLANLFHTTKKMEKSAPAETKPENQISEKTENTQEEEILHKALLEKNLDFLKDKTEKGEVLLSEIFKNSLPFLDITTEKLDANFVIFSFAFVAENSDILRPINGMWNISQNTIQIFSEIELQKISEDDFSVTLKNESEIPLSTHHSFFLLPFNEEVILKTPNENGIVLPQENFVLEKISQEKFSEKIVLENIEHSFLLKEKQ